MVMGALIGGVSNLSAEMGVIRAAARHVGLAFQIVDDVLDATADLATLGKTPGKDAKAGKLTYVKLHGIEKSRQLACDETEAALAELRRLPGDTGFLCALAAQMGARLK